MNDEVFTKNDRELLAQLRRADLWEEPQDDFYREDSIAEQLDDDCLREDESAFMLGYLAA
jgi:hypothetical protein